MKNPLNLFKSFFFWSLLGISTLVCLIWFFGDEIAISGIRPLASNQIRFVACILIVVFWLGKIVLRFWKEARRNALLVKEIQSTHEPIIKKTVTVTPMARKFSELNKILKDAKFIRSKTKLFNAEQYLYHLPWYPILGATGSGKTSVIKYSGLNFPLTSTADKSHDQKINTYDCDWFLTDNAVFFDTTGYFINKDNNHDWDEFVSLLNKYRPQQPINGLIVTVSVEELLSGESELQSLALSLKKRIQELYKQFNIKFPIYFIITKLDLLQGFQSFFAHLTEQERQEYFGIQFNSESADHDIESAQNKFAQLIEIFYSLSLDVVSKQVTIEDRANVFIFPDEFKRLSDSLTKFLQELAKHSKFEESVQWRGVYFSSAIAQDELFISNNIKLYEDFQLNKNTLYPHKNESRKNYSGFFLKKIFEEIIFAESNLASKNKVWSIKNRSSYWFGAISIGLFSAMALFLLCVSYIKNSRYLDDVKQRAIKLDESIRKEKELNFKNAIEFANQVPSVVQSEHIKDLNNPPFSYRIGLYQGAQMWTIGQSVYNRLLHDSAMPLISQNLDELLRTEKPGDRQFTYNSLKAYLMMFHKDKFNQEFMRNWLIENLFANANDGKQIDNLQKDAADKALRQVLAQSDLVFSVNYDEELVEKRRRDLAKIDITTIILDQTLQSAQQHKSAINSVSFSSLGGSQTHLLFRRKSGASLKEPIDPAYTREGYIKLVLPSLIKNTTQIFEEGSWVLGEYATSAGQTEDAIRQDVQRQYFQQYIKSWHEYINDLVLITPRNSQENIQIAKLLSDKNSPLINIIRGISDNTTLNLGDQLKAQHNNPIKDWLSKAGIDINQFVISSEQNENLGQLSGWIQDTPVDTAFANFHALLRAEKEQPATITSVIEVVNDLYVYLVAVNVAVEKGVDLPPDDPFVKYKAEIGRLPSPFREMLDNFSTIILERTDKVVDERLMSSLTKQLAPVAQQCEDMLAQGYPFQRTSPNDVAIESFTNIFGSNGIYQKFNQLTGQIASLAKVDSLDALMARNETFSQRFAALKSIREIKRVYFSNGMDTPKFNFTIKVILLDPELESVHISYDGKTQVYSHGPVVPLNLTWPAQSGNSQIKLEVISPEVNSTSISNNGAWSVFRLIEQGKITHQSNNATIVAYDIRGRKLVLEFTAFTPNNPFDLSNLRKFQCIK